MTGERPLLPIIVTIFKGRANKFMISIFHLEISGFGGLEVACWPLVPKFAGSNPAEAVGFFGRKIHSAPFFGGEVNTSVPCRKFTACKRTQK